MSVTNLKIATKFPLLVIGVAVLTGLAIGLTAQFKHAADLEIFAKQALSALREAKQLALESYLDTIRQDLRVLASTENVRDALTQLTDAADKLDAPPMALLSHLYVGSNPHPPAQRSVFDDAGDGSHYSKLHARYHPWFREIARLRGYHDIFLFSPEGDLVYSVAKEADFATNFRHGKWADSTLGKVFRALDADPRPGAESFVDFAHYEPSGQAASFLAAPIFDADGSYVGVLAIQMPTDRLNQVMRVSSGLGRTSQSYIVGLDRLMRTDSRLSSDSTILTTRVDTEAADRALIGEAGIEVERGYRGVPVVAAFAPLGFMDAHWAVITEIDRAELLRPVEEAAEYMLASGAGILLLATILGFLFGRTLALPIVRMTGNIRRLAAGDLDVPVDDGNRSDEIADMARALIVFRQNLIERREAEQALAAKEAELRLALDNMPGAMSLIGYDRRLLLANRQVAELFDIPQDSLIIGSRVEDAFQLLAKRGHFGTGPEDEQVDSAFEMLADPEPTTYERQIGTSRILECRRVPIPDIGVLTVSVDITERKHAEEALRRSEQELSEKSGTLESVLRSMNEGIVAFDRDLRLIAWNEPYGSIRNFPDDFLRVGLPFEDVVRHDVNRYHDDASTGDRDTIVRRVVEQARHSQPHAFERQRPDGTWIEVRGGPIEGGGFVSTCADVSERKSMEAALRASEERLLSILQQSPVGVCVTRHRDGRLVFANPRLKELFGFSEVSDEDLSSGRVHIEILDRFAEPDVRTEILSRYAAEGSVNDAEIQFVHRGGETLWALVSIMPFDHAGEPGRLNWLYDITERRAIEQEVIEQRRLLDQVLSNILQGVVKFDRNRQLAAWNEKFRDILGLPQALMTPGQPARALFSYLADQGVYADEDAATSLAERGRQVWAGEPSRGDLRLRGDRFFDVLSQPTEDGGVVVTYTDITERKRAEEQVRGAYRIIQESVQYASQIQRSLLPPARGFTEVFADHFVIWEPRDAVGGDFYWLERVRGGHLLVVCDCTGHGVPGAFMTILGAGALIRAISENREGDPAAVLAGMNRMIKHALQQDSDEGDADDGMELGACYIGHDRRLVFAGARFNLLVGSGAVIEQVKGDRTGIGYRRTDADFAFTTHEIEAAPGMTFYLHSDGITDQIGGERQLSFGRSRLINLLAGMHDLPLRQQAAGVRQAFAAYQGGQLRRDDVTIVGFKVR